MKRFGNGFGFCLLAIAALSISLAGCGKNSGKDAEKKDGDKTAGKKEGGHDEHEDHGPGPHGGTVGEFGGKYHIEIQIDRNKQEATVFILDGDAKRDAPIKAEKLTLSIKQPTFKVDLLPQPQTGEAAGTASRFVGKHSNLTGKQEFVGTVSAEVDGTPYSGDFKVESEAAPNK